MKTYLFNSTLLPHENFVGLEDQSQVETLLGQLGWQLCPPQPEFNPETEDCTWDRVEETWVVTPRPVVVPQSVTPRQLQYYLIEHGLKATIENALNALPETDNQRAKAWASYEYATEIRRDDPVVAYVGQVLQLGKEELDAMFITMAGL